MLVRGSATTDTRWPESAAWPELRALSSSALFRIVPTSVASPYLSGTTSTSEVAGESIASMMRASRRRFSA